MDAQNPSPESIDTRFTAYDELLHTPPEKGDSPPPPGSLRETFPADLLASVVVFLVALPLCMGIAIASGAPPASGLITGIIGGILVGGLAGCPLQVSGPAAGLSVVVLEMIQRFGLESFGLVVLLGGAIQLASGILGLGQWFRAVPPGVIHGMLAGIGVLIFSSQFHVMVDDKPRSGGLQNLLSVPEAIAKAVAPGETDVHRWAAAIGITTILIMMFWTKFAPRRLRLIPAPLMGVTVATFMAALYKLPIAFVQVPDSMAEAFRLLSSATLSGISSFDIWLGAFTIAVIASAETLLTAGAVDRLQSGPKTRYEKELMAQGVGNMLCGFLGGLPMTGVIVRSKANIDAGARTRLSTMLHGTWILALVHFFPQLLEMIPVASLAAVLVFTGWKLVDYQKMWEATRDDRLEFGIYVATIVGIVTTDLLKGVVLGIVLSAIKLLATLSRLGVWIDHDHEHNRATLHLDGVASFLLLPRLAQCLESVRPGAEVHVQIAHLDYVDHACTELLQAWTADHEAAGGRVVIDWPHFHALRVPRQARGQAERAKAAANPV